MRLDTTFIRLGLRVDADRLAAEVAAIPEEKWQSHPEGAPGNTALPLVAAHGDEHDHSTTAAMRPTPVLASMPYTRAIMASLGAPIGRARLMRIEAEGALGLHVDINRYWQDHMRIHVPVVTHPSVEFLCDGETRHMTTGEVWVFDTWRLHGVNNPAGHARIHLVIDTAGSSALWSLIDAGRAAGLEGPAVGPAVTELVEPVYESLEPPLVTPPWQQEVLARGVLADLRRSEPEVADGAMGAFVRDFLADWGALWRIHGDRPETLHRYVACVETYVRRLAAMPPALLPNSSDTANVLRQLLFGPALSPAAHAMLRDAGPQQSTPQPAPVPNPVPAPAPAMEATVSEQPQAAPSEDPDTVSPSTTTAPAPARRPARIDRPVFVVSSPRSGSTLMFETLAKAKNAYTIGSESHEVFERIPELHPSTHDWESNALGADDATDQVVHLLEEGFLARAFDRDRKGPVGYDPIRLLEKTPKNALRVPFLAEAFPDSVFVFLYRDPKAVISSMIDAWKSGRFVTYRTLPGWGSAPWSLLLPPGWKHWRGMTYGEVAARQWCSTMTTLLDGLEQLDPSRWLVVRYEDLIADPNGTANSLCERLGFEWDRPVLGALPTAAHTLDAPDPDKWRRNEDALTEVWHLVEPVMARAEAVMANPPVGPSLAKQVATAPARVAPATPEEAFGSSSTPSFADLLNKAKSSLIVTTYQAGRVVLLRPNADGGMNTHLRAFPRPMGVAVQRERMALGTNHTVWGFVHHEGLTERLPDGPHDACFVPRNARVTGDIAVHELAYAANGELWMVNTRFSCLATLDATHSFVPRWTPPFITALAPEDRCHLNGMAMVDGKPKYVTALGMTDDSQGWRREKVGGGVILDVDTNAVVAMGLTMPHSPRWHNDKLWVLDSGRGTLCTVNMMTGKAEPVAKLPGFTRGLTFIGRYALVGLSKVREHVFAGLPLAEHVRERQCGVWIVDTENGNIVGFLKFEGSVEEVFDVQLMRGMQHPELLEPTDSIIENSFLLGPDALKFVKQPG